MPRTATDTLHKILPLSSTGLEKDLLRIVPFDGVLNPVIPLINTFKREDIPDVILPWLIVEYGLGRLQQFVPNPRDLITEGLEFNRLIGTPAAISKVFDWFGIEAELVEATVPGLHFAEFQVKLISPATLTQEQLCLLAKALDIAKPARGRFRRIFNDAWDVGSFILDESDWGALLDNYSGVYGPEIGLCDDRQLWVSLGLKIDLSPENYALISGDVGGFTVDEVINISYISNTEYPILDDEFIDPPSFYSPHMSATMMVSVDGATVIGGLVDENGIPLVDESGIQLDYRIP